MKVLYSSLLILLLICIFIGVHSYLIIKMSDNISPKCENTIKLAKDDDWDGVLKNLDEIEKTWNRFKFWAAMTISTEDIEQLETSLMQSRGFAEINAKPDFLGEFIMFSKLAEHIPHREGFHIQEIL